MYFITDHVYHIYNRGNNKQRIFFSDRNYEFFLYKMSNQIGPFCEMLCWCLIPNHFHLMICATEKTCFERSSFGHKTMQELPYRIGSLLSSYSQAINKQNGTTGSLFQQKTKAKCITGQAAESEPTKDEYLVTCMHYIHQNPWKAGIVKKLEDWKYSSFKEYTGSTAILKCNKEKMFSLTGYDPASFYSASYGVLDESILQTIS